MMGRWVELEELPRPNRFIPLWKRYFRTFVPMCDC